MSVKHYRESSNLSYATMRRYSVGVAGLAVNQLPFGSGGSTPSRRTGRNTATGAWPDREAPPLQGDICGFESHRLHVETDYLKTFIPDERNTVVGYRENRSGIRVVA